MNHLPAKKRELPNGISLFEINSYETDLVYREIFDLRLYSRYGIKTTGLNTIMDIGANIGLFSIYALLQNKDAHIYAVEASAPVAHILQQNLDLFTTHATVINAAIASQPGERTLSVYPGYSIMSGFFTDESKDLDMILSGVKTALLEQPDFTSAQDIPEWLMRSFVDGKLKNPVTETCRALPLPALLDEYQVTNIDLLKIDIEKSEMELLESMDMASWKKIRQVVMEVYRYGSDAVKILESAGFTTASEPEPHFGNSEVLNVYAWRG